VRTGKHLLQHERVHKYHEVLQQVQAEHDQFVILAAVARHLATVGEEHEVFGAVPVLDDVQAVVDFAPDRPGLRMRT